MKIMMIDFGADSVVKLCKVYCQQVEERMRWSHRPVRKQPRSAVSIELRADLTRKKYKASDNHLEVHFHFVDIIKEDCLF